MGMSATRWNASAGVALVIAATAIVLGGGSAVAGALSSTTHGPHGAPTARHVDDQPSDRVHLQAVVGKVTGVNGVTTTDTCGTSGAAGTVAVENPKTSKSTTVTVTATTKFLEPMTTGASFADVCVGKSVAALGTTTSGTFSAASVTVLPGRTLQPQSARAGHR